MHYEPFSRYPPRTKCYCQVHYDTHLALGGLSSSVLVSEQILLQNFCSFLLDEINPVGMYKQMRVIQIFYHQSSIIHLIEMKDSLPGNRIAIKRQRKSKNIRTRCST
jgi:hypothetical protein